MHSRNISYVPSAEEIKNIQQQQERLRKERESMYEYQSLCPYCHATLCKYFEPKIHTGGSIIITTKCSKCRHFISYHIHYYARKWA